MSSDISIVIQTAGYPLARGDSGMADEQEHFQSCVECGATVYPEHLDKQLAGEWEGKLLCHHCLDEKRAAAGSGAWTSKVDAPVSLVDEAPISLMDEGPSVTLAARGPAIRAIGGGPGGMPEAAAAVRQTFRRPLYTGTPNATRCRVFHCKLADAAFGHMAGQINEWADIDEHIEIKFATSCIGVVEGKHADPHLIVTVFY